MHVQPDQPKKQERKSLRQLIAQISRKKEEKVQSEEMIKQEDKEKGIRRLLARLKKCATMDDTLEMALTSPVYHEAASEDKQMIRDLINEWFSDQKNQEFSKELSSFLKKINHSSSREEALAFRHSPFYLQATPQAAQLIDERIEQVHPEPTEKPRFWARFWSWFKYVGLPLLIATSSALVDSLSFFEIENYREFKESLLSLSPVISNVLSKLNNIPYSLLVTNLLIWGMTWVYLRKSGWFLRK